MGNRQSSNKLWLWAAGGHQETQTRFSAIHGEYAMSQELYEKACIQNQDMSLQVFAET